MTVVLFFKRTKAGCEYEELQKLVCLSSGSYGNMENSRGIYDFFEDSNFWFL